MISLRRGRVTSLAFSVLLLAASLLPMILSGPTVNAAVLYDSGDPTSAEQLVLEYINRARSDPVGEGQRLGIDIREGLSDPSLVGPRPPLAMNKILLGIAEAHSRNMYTLNYYSHNDPNGDTPFDRMIHAGYNYLSAGENMAGGAGVSATFLEDLLMVDAGTAGRLHRVNMLDFFNPYPCSSPPCVYYEVGIGYYQGTTPNGIGLSSLMTQDFGTANTGPFLLGVAYNDLNHNNFYDIGEGIAGVTITASGGSYYAITSSSGGYAIPTSTSGTMTVTASGPGFGPIAKTVTLNGANVKVDFTTSAQTSTTTSTQTSTTSSTVSTTSSTFVTTTQTQTTSFSQTTTSVANPPSIMLNPLFAPAGSTVAASGSGFSSSDTACSLSGNAVSTSSCSIFGGTLTASFVVANVPFASYVVLVTGSPTGDSASIIFTVTAPTTQTTISTSTSTTVTSSEITQNTTVSSYTIGGSTSSQETTLTTASSTQTSTVNTQTATPDFLVLAPSNAINLAQSSTGDLAISVQSIGTFDQQVQLNASGLPEGVEISFSPNPVNPSEGGITSSTATLIVTRSVPTGIYQFEVVATSGSVSKEITLSLQVSGCLIATATFGSELAPEVQFLRDFRDNKILQTFAGSSFMVAFNAWYYSFSPGVAQYEAINPTIRLIVKVFIYPLIWILQIGSVVFETFSFNHEAASVFSGISISALIGAVYLAGPVLILRRTFSARRGTRTLGGASLFVFLGGLLIVALAEVFKAEMMMTIGSSIVVVSTMAISALLTSRAIGCVLQVLGRD